MDMPGCELLKKCQLQYNTKCRTKGANDKVVKFEKINFEGTRSEMSDYKL